MIRSHLSSDQLDMWSVTNDRSNHRRSQATPQAASAQAATSGLHPSRFLDRALQALRQSQLQVRRRAGTRTQVLPFGELSRIVAEDGLRCPGQLRAGQREPGQLHPDSRDPGTNLRDQSRTAASARAAVRDRGEPGPPVAHRPLRFARWRQAVGQHADRPDRRQPGARRGGQP